MTLAEALAKLQELQAKKAQGQNVDAETAQVIGRLNELGFEQRANQPAPGGGGSSTAVLAPPAAPAFAPAALAGDERAELEQLRAAQTQATMQGIAAQLGQAVITQQDQQQRALAEGVGGYLEAYLKSKGVVASSDDKLKSTIYEVLNGTRGASRDFGSGASADVLAHLAAGGGFDPATGVALGGGSQEATPKPSPGADRELDAMWEKKSIGRIMAVLAKAHKHGGVFMTDVERRFLQKMSSKAQAQGTDTAGGFLIHPEWMEDILPVIRANAVVRRSGARTMPFNKQMMQTSISTGTSAFYTQENARIPVSEMTFAETPILTPKYLTALVPVSNYLLDNEDAVDGMVKDDMTAALTVREDLAFLQGTGSGGEPTGIRNQANLILNPIAPGADGFTPSLPDLRRIKGRTRMAGTINPRWTWFFHPQFLTYLETLTDTLGRFLVDAGILQINEDGVSGKFDGLPFFASYQIPTALTLGASSNCTYLLLVDVNQLIIGESYDLSLDVSSEATYSPDGGTTHISAFQQNQTVFRVVIGHDIVHRRPAIGIIDQEGVRV